MQNFGNAKFVMRNFARCLRNNPFCENPTIYPPPILLILFTVQTLDSQASQLSLSSIGNLRLEAVFSFSSIGNLCSEAVFSFSSTGSLRLEAVFSFSSIGNLRSGALFSFSRIIISILYLRTNVHVNTQNSFGPYMRVSSHKVYLIVVWKLPPRNSALLRCETFFPPSSHFLSFISSMFENTVLRTPLCKVWCFLPSFCRSPYREPIQLLFENSVSVLSPAKCKASLPCRLPFTAIKILSFGYNRKSYLF